MSIKIEILILISICNLIRITIIRFYFFTFSFVNATKVVLSTVSFVFNFPQVKQFTKRIHYKTD